MRLLLRADQLLQGLVAVALAADVGIVFVGVISRYVFNAPLDWTEEIAQLFLLCFSFIGMAIAFRRGQHIAITVLVRRLPAPAQGFVAALNQIAIVVFALTVAWQSVGLIIRRIGHPSPEIGLSLSWFMVPLTAGMALMGVFALCNLAALQRRPALAAVAVSLAMAVAIYVWGDAWLPFARSLNPLVPILSVYLLALLAGMPIGFDIGLAALAFLALQGTVPLTILPQRMEEGTEGFVLLAVPFFVLTGAIMELGGISGRLIDFVRSLIGHVRGGLGLVIVVSMYLFSGISGSKSADISAVGSVLIPQMRRRGHDPAEAVAVLTASAAMGETIPPSIAMLVLGSITSLSVGALFVAGLVPALVIALCLMGLVFLRARRTGAPVEPRAGARKVLQALRRSVLAMLMPAIVLGGIVLGIATPTEVSSFAVVYALILATTVYRGVRLRQLYGMLLSSACMTGVVLFMVSTATVLAWILSIEGIPQAVAAWMISISDGPTLFLVLSLVLVITLGALLEGLPALVILAPLLLPVVPALHIDKLHFGIVLVIAMGIGASVPPIGIMLMVGCAVGGTTVEATIRPYLPYFLMLLAGLAIVTYVPWFTLVLPRSFGFE